jgi:protein gp37
MEIARGELAGKYRHGFKLTMHENTLDQPLFWRKPQNIFVNSMSDMFHRDVSTPFIHRVFDTMMMANWHRYQVLTKRSQRLRRLSAQLPWSQHIWMGVTVEEQDYTYRIDDLRNTNAYIKFLSCEPLLGPIERLDLTGIDWVICGGESGPGARPMREEWALSLRDQCQSAGVRFFFKQWGGVHKKKAGRMLEGRTWDEMPSTA